MATAAALIAAIVLARADVPREAPRELPLANKIVHASGRLAVKGAREEARPGTGFGKLLARLDPDPERAEATFERFRRSLTKFFDWRGAHWPEDCADETLDRLAQKMEQGVAVIDVAAFARGIARLVLQESARAQERLTPLDDLEVRGAVPAEEEPRDEPLAAHLDRCLESLTRDARELVLGYYGGGSGRGKIEGRRRLARDLRLSDNALRSRVQRLRDQLEDCVRARTSRGTRHILPGSDTSR